MGNVIILDENREYDHEELKKILNEVREFFQKKLKVIVPEWINEMEVIEEAVERSAIKDFYIEKGVDPIYLGCNGYDDVKGILDLFEQRLNGLLDNLDDLLDNNQDLEEESRKSLESYASAVEKCVRVYELQRKKRMTKFKELLTVEEIQDELRQLFSEIILNYIIVVLFDGLYERVKNNSGQVYKMVIREVNEFLSENGVYTRNVFAREPIDPEYMEPTPDSAENFTTDYQKFETVDEIYRYPYLFSDERKIADGQVRIWRRKD